MNGKIVQYSFNEYKQLNLVKMGLDKVKIGVNNTSKTYILNTTKY